MCVNPLVFSRTIGKPPNRYDLLYHVEKLFRCDRLNLMLRSILRLPDCSVPVKATTLPVEDKPVEVVEVDEMHTYVGKKKLSMDLDCGQSVIFQK